MEVIFMILIFIGIIFSVYYFSKTPENLEINENKILTSNMNSNNSNTTIINNNRTM